MSTKKQKEKKDYKQYYLSKEDLENLVGRRNIQSYLLDLISKDMLNYIDVVIKPRLSIPLETPASLDPSLKFFTIPAEWGRDKKDNLIAQLPDQLEEKGLTDEETAEVWETVHHILKYRKKPAPVDLAKFTPVAKEDAEESKSQPA
jgi:hypothetical protein